MAREKAHKKISKKSLENISIVWFKRDLRLADHAPLAAAAAAGYPVLPLYCRAGILAQDTSSTRHWQFIRDCLLELDAGLTPRPAACSARW